MGAMKERLVARLPDGPATVEVRRTAKAKRMTLRIPPGHANPIVTIPIRARLANAEEFVRSHERWLAARLAERCPGRPFADGATIPLRGEPHRIVWVGGPRTVTVADGELRVGGPREHLARRLADHLRRAARADLEAAVAEFTAKVGRRPAALRIKDTRAQWGSCTPAGVLSFSWRLVLAPPHVLRYVAAHEVAHLVELNHSRAFWRLNAALDPNHLAARDWLKRNGRALHAVGAGTEAEPA